MKCATARPYADPEKAARRILDIEKINEPFLFRDRGSPAEYGAGLKLAIERGWLKMHESGTFVTFTPAGAELFAWRAKNARFGCPRRAIELARPWGVALLRRPQAQSSSRFIQRRYR